jgi:membrane protease YdiL (CAAX protease family)
VPALAQGGPHWRATLLYVPLLYAIGWLSARPLGLIAPSLRSDQIDLAGVVVALALLLLTLPVRLRRVWGESRPWYRLGLRRPPTEAVQALLQGLVKALLLLGLLAAVLLATDQGAWSWRLDWGMGLNGLALIAAVGFAEELVFRGWLWGELALQSGPRRSLLHQSAIFALLHPWYRVEGPGAIGLLGGLILLGVALALQRRADGGSLWGTIGLHGGLVGGWFVIQSGILKISSSAPAWLVGPGAPSPNPIGGLIGWLGLVVLLMLWRPSWQE